MYHYVRPVNYKSTLSKLLDTLKTKTIIFLPNSQIGSKMMSSSTNLLPLILPIQRFSFVVLMLQNLT